MWYHRALVHSVVAEDSRVLSYQVIDYVCNKDLIDLYSCFTRVIVVSDCWPRDELVSDPLSLDRN